MSTDSARFVLSNGSVFDGKSQKLVCANVFVRGNRIAEVSDRPANPGDGKAYDVAGKTVMPGLIDAHIHAYINSVDIAVTEASPPTYLGVYAGKMMSNILRRGFTTVRDTGGADYGLWLALRDGLIDGPRLFYCGRLLSQTGGHGDFRRAHAYCAHDDQLLACGCGRTTHVAFVVDGVDAVRKAVRENLRRGGSFIKITGSGGVSSTGDKLESAQFSDDEIRAIVDEVERESVYVTAHIHPDGALRRAIKLGVHCIEHGTLIEPDTARMAADAGTSIVPTIAVIDALSRRGREYGYPQQSLDKLAKVSDEAVKRLQYMKDAGVRIGFGTDLIGQTQNEQCIEWTLRSPIFSNYEMLVQATSMNADIIGAKGELGIVETGALADLLVVNGNPLEDISVLQNDGAGMPMVIKDGCFKKGGATREGRVKILRK